MSKDTLRTEAARLGKASDKLSSAVRAHLREWLSPRLPGTIAAYLAMPTEITVEPLFEGLPGWHWVLVRLEEDESFTFRDRAVPRETHPLGMRQPQDVGVATPQNQVDIYLVPGVLFSSDGSRLGRGGGFYDRILSQRRSDSIAIGVSVGERVVGDVPTEGHDQRVDYLATEEGVIECSPPTS